MPQQDPFAQYAVKPKAATDDPFAAYAVKAERPTRPVSAEDFLPPEQSGVDKALSVGGGLVRGIAGGIAGAGKLGLDAQKMLMLGGNFGSGDDLKTDLLNLLGAQGEQFKKAATRAGEGRISEAAGHGAAGLLPVLGPAAANIGEKAETDPYGAAGEAGALLAGSSPTALRAAGRGARAAGRGAAAVGRKVAPVAAEGAKMGAAELAVQAMGLPPFVGSMLRYTLRGTMKGKPSSAPKSGPPITDVPPPRMKHGPVEPPIPPRMRYGPERPPPAPADPVTEVVPPKMKHGPEPPPSARTAPKAKASPVMGQRNYFLRGQTAQAPQPKSSASTGYRSVSDIESAIPTAGATTRDGLMIRKEIPNLRSIESSLEKFEELPGVREIPMDLFDPAYTPKPYSVSESARLDKLQGEIAASKEINPLIVVLDKEKHPYILEGGHRFDALRRLGVKSVPAKVVIDMSESTGLKFAAPTAAPTGRSVGIEDLPASWRSRVGTPLTKPGGPQLPSAEALGELQSRGLSAADALEAVQKNPSLTNETRLQLRNALLAMFQ